MTSLRDLPRLHTLVYRAGPETWTKWAPLAALRTLVTRDYWPEVPRLFPALEAFRYTNTDSRLASAKRDEAMRALPSLTVYSEATPAEVVFARPRCTHIYALYDHACHCDRSIVCPGQ
jgi:hypothetical protein